MKDVIIYFPWGAGGDFLKNVITVNPEFDFNDDKEFTDEINPSFESRYQFFLNYYKPVLGEEWSHREWQIRKKFFGRYYEAGGIRYWNPWARTVFDCYGSPEELERILSNERLHCYDRTRINRGEIADEISDYTLKECKHVFLIPTNVRLITDIYCSKDPSLNQFSANISDDAKKHRALLINKFRTYRLKEFAETLGGDVYKYSADQLYSNTGAELISTILDDLGIEMPVWIVNDLHQAWLDNTKQIYSAYYNKDLP